MASTTLGLGTNCFEGVAHFLSKLVSLDHVLEEEDILSLDDPAEADVFEAEFDETLDHLLKHAMKSGAQEPEPYGP